MYNFNAMCYCPRRCCYHNRTCQHPECQRWQSSPSFLLTDSTAIGPCAEPTKEKRPSNCEKDTQATSVSSAKEAQRMTSSKSCNCPSRQECSKGSRNLDDLKSLSGLNKCSCCVKPVKYSTTVGLDNIKRNSGTSADFNPFCMERQKANRTSADLKSSSDARKCKSSAQSGKSGAMCSEANVKRISCLPAECCALLKSFLSNVMKEPIATGKPINRNAQTKSSLCSSTKAKKQENQRKECMIKEKKTKKKNEKGPKKLKNKTSNELEPSNSNTESVSVSKPTESKDIWLNCNIPIQISIPNTIRLDNLLNLLSMPPNKEYPMPHNEPPCQEPFPAANTMNALVKPGTTPIPAPVSDRSCGFCITLQPMLGFKEKSVDHSLVPTTHEKPMTKNLPAQDVTESCAPKTTLPNIICLCCNSSRPPNQRISKVEKLKEKQRKIPDKKLKTQRASNGLQAGQEKLKCKDAPNLIKPEAAKGRKTMCNCCCEEANKRQFPNVRRRLIGCKDAQVQPTQERTKRLSPNLKGRPNGSNPTKQTNQERNLSPNLKGRPNGSNQTKQTNQERTCSDCRCSKVKKEEAPIVTTIRNEPTDIQQDPAMMSNDFNQEYPKSPKKSPIGSKTTDNTNNNNFAHGSSKDENITSYGHEPAGFAPTPDVDTIGLCNELSKSPSISLSNCPIDNEPPPVMVSNNFSKETAKEPSELPVGAYPSPAFNMCDSGKESIKAPNAFSFRNKSTDLAPTLNSSQFSKLTSEHMQYVSSFGYGTTEIEISQCVTTYITNEGNEDMDESEEDEGKSKQQQKPTELYLMSKVYNAPSKASLQQDSKMNSNVNEFTSAFGEVFKCSRIEKNLRCRKASPVNHLVGSDITLSSQCSFSEGDKDNFIETELENPTANTSKSMRTIGSKKYCSGCKTALPVQGILSEEHDAPTNLSQIKTRSDYSRMRRDHSKNRCIYCHTSLPMRGESKNSPTREPPDNNHQQRYDNKGEVESDSSQSGYDSCQSNLSKSSKLNSTIHPKMDSNLGVKNASQSGQNEDNAEVTLQMSSARLLSKIGKTPFPSGAKLNEETSTYNDNVQHKENETNYDCEVKSASKTCSHSTDLKLCLLKKAESNCMPTLEEYNVTAVMQCPSNLSFSTAGNELKYTQNFRLHPLSQENMGSVLNDLKHFCLQTSTDGKQTPKTPVGPVPFHSSHNGKLIAVCQPDEWQELQTYQRNVSTISIKREATKSKDDSQIARDLVCVKSESTNKIKNVSNISIRTKWFPSRKKSNASLASNQDLTSSRATVCNSNCSSRNRTIPKQSRKTQDKDGVERQPEVRTAKKSKQRKQSTRSHHKHKRITSGNIHGGLIGPIRLKIPTRRKPKHSQKCHQVEMLLKPRLFRCSSVDCSLLTYCKSEHQKKANVQGHPIIAEKIVPMDQQLYQLRDQMVDPLLYSKHLEQEQLQSTQYKQRLNGDSVQTQQQQFQPPLVQSPIMKPPLPQPALLQPALLQPLMLQPQMLQPSLQQPQLMQPPFLQPPLVQPPILQPPMLQPPLLQLPLMSLTQMQPSHMSQIMNQTPRQAWTNYIQKPPTTANANVSPNLPTQSLYVPYSNLRQLPLDAHDTTFFSTAQCLQGNPATNLQYQKNVGKWNSTAAQPQSNGAMFNQQTHSQNGVNMPPSCLANTCNVSGQHPQGNPQVRFEFPPQYVPNNQFQLNVEKLPPGFYEQTLNKYGIKRMSFMSEGPDKDPGRHP